jgi:hypothetical protein
MIVVPQLRHRDAIRIHNPSWWSFRSNKLVRIVFGIKHLVNSSESSNSSPHVHLNWINLRREESKPRLSPSSCWCAEVTFLCCGKRRRMSGLNGARSVGRIARRILVSALERYLTLPQHRIRTFCPNSNGRAYSVALVLISLNHLGLTLGSYSSR